MKSKCIDMLYIILPILAFVAFLQLTDTNNN